jgi:WXXGXW repeat (2 copies)
MTRYERSAIATHTPVRGAVLCAMLALGMAGLATLHPSTAQAAIGIDIDIAPPADRVVVAPPPRAGFVWAPGYWFWDGHTHVWHDGRWMRERHGYHWVPDAWVARGPHYHYVRGHWAH